MKRWMRSRTALSAGLLLVLGCAAEEEAAPPLAPLVVVAPVDARDLEERVEVPGELVAVQEAEIAAEVDGRITELLRDEGDAVEAGGPILRIDPERRELDLASARAQLSEAAAALGERRRDLKRVEALHRQGAASEAQLDTSRSALEGAASRLRAAEAQVGVAERALRDATVRAPFAGLVARRHVSPGEFVRPGSPLVQLVALDPVEVEFHVPERDSGRVRMGLPVAVSVAPYPDEMFDGTVTMISPTIDPRTRTLRVKAQLENDEGRLRPGLFARTDLGLAHREDVPMIPEEAVLQRADGPIVYRYTDDGRAERRVVSIGLHRAGEVEVLEGLEPGEWVLTRGHTRLADGAVVRATTQDGAPAARPLAQSSPPAEEDHP